MRVGDAGEADLLQPAVAEFGNDGPVNRPTRQRPPASTSTPPRMTRPLAKVFKRSPTAGPVFARRPGVPVVAGSVGGSRSEPDGLDVFGLGKR